MDKYGNYKDSGLKWIGHIPDHWEVKKLGNFLRLFSEKGYPDAQLLSVTRERGVILRDKDSKEENHNFVPDDLSGYKHVHVGDFVINKMKSWQGSYGVSNYDGIVSPAYFTCTLKGIDKEFFSLAIRAKIYTSFFMQYSKGIRVDQWDLEPTAMKSIPIVVPPFEEQLKIVSYLNNVVPQIDEAIAQQQKMIDLLNERKQIIIQKAVTKGLDPNTPMKDSGIEWIGEIPAQWNCDKAKYHLKSTKQIVGKECSKYERLALTLKGVIKRFEGDGVGLNPEKLDTYQIVEENDLIFKLIDLENVSTSRVGLSPFQGIVSPAYIRISVLNKVLPRYAEYYYKNMWKCRIFNDLGSPGVRSNLSSSDLLNLPLLIPPFFVQQSIVNHLDDMVSRIDEFIFQQQDMINLLTERKQIIINEVVTGKVKVI